MTDDTRSGISEHGIAYFHHLCSKYYQQDLPIAKDNKVIPIATAQA